MKLRHCRRRLAVTCLFGCAFAAVSSRAPAAVITWANAGEGDWNVGSNWTGGVVPTGAPMNDTAQISNGGTADISAAQGALTIGQLTVANDNSSTGHLKITGGSLTTTASDLRIGGNATSTLSATGTLDQTGGDILLSAGNVNVGIGSSTTGTTPSNGTYNISAGTLTIASANIFACGNRGTGTVNQSGGTVYVRGTAANAAAGVIQLGRNTAAVPGSGTYTLSAGLAAASNLQFGNANQTSNTLPTNTFNLQGTGNLKAGTISILNTNATNIFSFTGGTLSANTINLPTLTNNGGTLSPETLSFTGQANLGDIDTSLLGTMTINGNYTQGATGNLAIDLASLSSFDSVSIGAGAPVDNAVLAGNITVATLAGYDPNPGDTFDILTADSITNGATIVGTTPGGKSYTPSIVTGGDGRQVLRLTVTPEPSSLSLLTLAGARLFLRRRTRRA